MSRPSPVELIEAQRNWRSYFAKRTRRRNGDVAYLDAGGNIIATGTVFNVGKRRGGSNSYSYHLTSPVEIQGGSSRSSLDSALLYLDALLVRALTYKAAGVPMVPDEVPPVQTPQTTSPPFRVEYHPGDLMPDWIEMPHRSTMRFYLPEGYVDVELRERSGTWAVDVHGSSTISVQPGASNAVRIMLEKR